MKKVKSTKGALIKKMSKNLEDLYRKFFIQLLKKAKEKTDLRANVRRQRNFCTATRNGLKYSYIVKTRPNGGCGRVELYIFQGNRESNEERYNRFLKNREDIEEIFGVRLRWRGLIRNRRSYIIDYIIPGLTFEEKRRWPELQGKMVDAMVMMRVLTLFADLTL